MELMNQNRIRLRDFIDKHSLIANTDMTLRAGSASSFYFDNKKTTLNGEALQWAADAFLEEINTLPDHPIAIGGLTMGADFIVAAVVLRAFQTGHPTVNGSIVRKEAKKHGTKNHIENEMPKGTKIVVVDDVITSGKSTADACDKLIEAGYKVIGVIALVDREAGGAEMLAEKYRCPVRAVLRKRDFPRI